MLWSPEKLHWMLPPSFFTSLQSRWEMENGKWKGTAHAFILHWQDQVRKYHTLATKQKLTTDMQKTMLENAVHSIPALRSVKVQAEQQKAYTGIDLSYSQYSALLLSAAQQHDKVLIELLNRHCVG